MRGPLGTALSSLTGRGRCLIAAGITVLLLGMLLGERPLVQIAVFVLALPVLSAALVAREHFRVTSRRTVVPARVPRGEDAEVLLEVVNADRRTGGLWEISERLPASLGESPSFVVDRLGPRATARLPYRVHGGRRGRHALGPLQLRIVDPFGLVARSTSAVETVPLVVVPRVRPLGPGGPGTGHGGSGDGMRRSIAVHGEDDVSTREYRHGDDLRKVHWRATARTGELMVRLEERPWRAQASLFLDTRARAHLTAARHLPARAVRRDDGDPYPPPDSFEWLIEAAASIGVSLARRGAVVRAVTDAGELLSPSGRSGLGPEDLLDRLAGLGPTRTPGLAAGVDQLSRAAGDGPVVCLLGAVGPDDIGHLLRVRSGPSADLAVLLDVGSWAEWADGSRGRRSAPGPARGELARQRDEAADVLRAAGWQVAVAGAGQSVEHVWAELTGRAAAPVAAEPGSLGVPA